MDPQQQANNYMGQAVTAQANYPDFQAQTLQGNINQAGLPQAAQQQTLDYNTFAKMFKDDPYGQQYMNQNFNNAGSVGSPTGTPVKSTASNVIDKSLQGIIPNMPSLRDPSVVSTIPQLTTQNIGQGFQGFTDPSHAAQARTQDLSNISGTMQAIQSLIGNNWTAVQNASSQTDQNQLAKIQALMNLANFYQTGANQKASGGGSLSQAQLQQQAVGSIKAEAQKGATLQQLMQKYVPEQADADSVMQIYKQFNYGKGKNKKGHGDPIESLGDLKSRYGINPDSFGTSQTSSEIQKKNSYGAALDLAGQFESTYGTKFLESGAEKSLPTNLVKNIPGLSNSRFVNQRTASMQSDIGPLRDQMMNALSGAGVTGAEATRLESWLPDTFKSPSENARNWKSLSNYLRANYRTNAKEEYPTAGVGGVESSGKSIKIGKYQVTY